MTDWGLVATAPQLKDGEKVVIDLAKARELAEKAVEKRGRDFQYNTAGRVAGVRCWYRPRPEYDELDPRSWSGCLVGEALLEAGIVMDAKTNIPAIDLCEEGVLPEGYEITSEAARFFAALQEANDDGYTWGDALDMAVRDYFDE